MNGEESPDRRTPGYPLPTPAGSQETVTKGAGPMLPGWEQPIASAYGLVLIQRLNARFNA